METSALLNVEPAKRKRKHLPKSLSYKYYNENNHEPKIHKAVLSKHHHSKLPYEKNHKGEHRNGHRRNDLERKAHMYHLLANGTNIIKQPQRSLRGQEIRRQRQRIVEARRQRHRILRENLKRQKAAKAGETIKIEELSYVNHHKAVVPKNSNEKQQKMNYHHYDINTGDEKPEKISVFGSWFTSH